MKFSKLLRGGALGAVILSWGWSAAFQIGPLGTRHEERLTNEANSTLADIAGKLGVLVKAPVHEEITPLGKWCHVERTNLASDTYCSGRDVGFASPYVIYGVCWNDLPLFRLGEGQGNCDYLGRKNVCRSQTIRFSTQPACWYCLFKDGERKAQSKAIVGSNKTANSIPGNLMTRSRILATSSSCTAWPTRPTCTPSIPGPRSWNGSSLHGRCPPKKSGHRHS